MGKEQDIHVKFAGTRLAVSKVKVSLTSLTMNLNFGVSETKSMDNKLCTILKYNFKGESIVQKLH